MLRVRVPSVTLSVVVAMLLAILGGVLCVGAGLRRQLALIEHIEERGGHVQLEDGLPEWIRGHLSERLQAGSDRIVSVTLTSPEFSDADLVRLRAHPHIRSLHLISAKITDEGLRLLDVMKELEFLNLNSTDVSNAGLLHLRALPSLRGLDLTSTAIGDEGLRNLCASARLTSLRLMATRITDDGVLSLASMSELDELSLDSTSVTDEGARRLIGLPRLRFLILNSTRLTNEGLRHLAGLTSLVSLQAVSTWITQEGIDEFKRRVPKCSVKRYLEVGPLL